MFKNERKKNPPAVSIYADFECYQPKTDIPKGNSSKIVSRHIPSGFGFYVKSRYEDRYASKYVGFSGEGDVPKKFIEELLKVRDEIASIPAYEMKMTSGIRLSMKKQLDAISAGRDLQRRIGKFATMTTMMDAIEGLCTTTVI